MLLDLEVGEASLEDFLTAWKRLVSEEILQRTLLDIIL
jgi:hypothetical protein